MACNRMFILCVKCEEALCIGKTNNDGYYGADNKKFSRALQEFYNRHDMCGDNFKIVYENTEPEITDEQWKKWKEKWWKNE